MRRSMNKQEKMWSGKFGDDYTKRCVDRVKNNTHFFQDCIPWDSYPGSRHEVNSVIEFGAGSGENIKAIQKLFPNTKFTAIEINHFAIKELKKIKNVKVHNISALDYDLIDKYDLVLTKGFLIHIHPDNLKDIYKRLYDSCGKYILICEYYNPIPMTIAVYRNQEDALWKRDFAGEMMDIYSDLKLLACGFAYHRDEYPQDDITWFLLRKEN